MTDRGSTRPEMGRPEQKEDMQDMMSPAHRAEMLRMHHEKTLWVYWTLLILGFWMMLTPLTFDFATATTAPAGGREVWLGLPERARLLAWSDFLSGFLLVVFGWRALTPDRPFSLWAACFLGFWLNLAPLVFWAPNPLIYLNDTLVGTLAIALTILVPGMPNMIKFMGMGGELPPGWSYNPSSWPQRSIMIALGLAGWLVSRYLAAFQLGYLPEVAEPFFGDGSRKVLTSEMSRSLPISDGGLGAFAYTFEFLMGFMGSQARWRTMPWMVTFFGILVIPLGLVHIFLVGSQPVTVGEWCSYCLVAAAIMLPMIPLTVDEVVAMCQFMALKKRQGESLWKLFWLGGGMEEAGEDRRTPKLSDLPAQPLQLGKAMFWGMSFPWTLILATFAGVWLMAAPALLPQEKSAADLSHIIGALVVTVSVVSMGEPIRALRFLNLAAAASLIIATVIIAPETSVLAANIISGLAVALLSLPCGAVRESFGSWDRFVR